MLHYLWLLAFERTLIARFLEGSIDLGHFGSIMQLNSMHKLFASPTRTCLIFLAILVFLLYTVMKDEETPIMFMGCVCVHIVVMIAYVVVYEVCSTFQARVTTNNPSVNQLIGSDARHHYMPLSEPLATRRRLLELRNQVALLDRELDEFAYITLSELASANVSGIPFMSEEEINALPVHNYVGSGLESEDAPPEQASPSASAEERLKRGTKDEDRTCDDLTCNICLEQVIKGDLVRRLPCSHQFHRKCIDAWLALKASCPLCKSMLGSGAHQSMEGETSSDDEAF